MDPEAKNAQSEALASPVVVVASGGSGTRAVSLMLRSLGVALGSGVDPRTDDAMVFSRVHPKWIDPFVLDRRGVRRMSGRKRAKMVADLQDAVRDHLADANPAPGAAWGWKNPASMFLVPLLDEQFPLMRCIHLVRDPRDMAFSPNRRQAWVHGAAYFSPEEGDEPVPIKMALLWRRVNNDTLAYGASMGDRYMMVRYEDLCLDPRKSAETMAALVGVSPEAAAIEEAAKLVSVPSSIGRWRTQDPRLLERLAVLLEQELVRYGYADQEWLARVDELLPSK